MQQGSKVLYVLQRAFSHKKANTCVSSKDPPIKNCQIVDFSDTEPVCALCMPGYATQFLMDNYECIDAPENCQEINLQEGGPYCTLCRSGYYDGVDNVCYLNGTWSKGYKFAVLVMIVLILVFLLIVGLIVYCIMRCCGCRKVPAAGSDGYDLVA
jgi:hypothetical protein